MQTSPQKTFNSSDFIIVGGGIIGMLTARYLRKEGHSVTLVEKGLIGGESSWAGGGILSPLYPWRYLDAVTELARWGQENYPSELEVLHEEAGFDPEYQKSGLLFFDMDDEAEQAINWSEKFGYRLERVDAQQLRDIEPNLDFDTVEHGYWMPEIGQVRNPRLVKSLKAAMSNLGVDMYPHTEVKELIEEGGCIRGVKTPKGEFYADKVLIAGGAWSAQLLEGIVSMPRIAPVKGQMIVFDAEPGVVSRITLSKGRYLIPRRDGHVVMGSTVEHSDFDKTISEIALEDLKNEACRIIPALKDYAVEKQWAGLRPGSIDGVPYIGEHPELKGLYLNAGHFRNGVVIGLGSCRVAADLLLGNSQSVIPVEPYAISEERLIKDRAQIDLRNAI